MHALTASPEELASNAIGRLRELIQSMRDTWQHSINELPPDAAVDLYVVDTDIVMMFMSPQERHNYGALLRYDQVARKNQDTKLEELESLTVEFLGNLLFFQLRPSLPVALLPDHAVELEFRLNDIGERAMEHWRNWEGVIAALKVLDNTVYKTSRDNLYNAEQLVAQAQFKDRYRAEQINKTSRDNLYDAEKLVAQAQSEDRSHAEQINALLKPIFDSLRSEGAIGKLFRFDNLVNGERLRHIDRLALLDEQGKPSYLPTLRAGDNSAIPSIALLERRLEKKMIDLQAYKPPRAQLAGGQHSDALRSQKRRRNAQNDARALAHLAWLNEQLRTVPYFIDIGSERRRVGRFLLISGSRLITRAIHELGLSELKRVIFPPLSLLGHQLMDEYVRSSTELAYTPPQALKTSLTVLFLDSMQGSLSQAIAGGDLDDIMHAVNQSRRDHLAMIESWKGKQLLSPEGPSDTVSDAIRSLVETGESIEKLNGYLENLSLKAWQKFARSIAFLNYRNADTRGVQRNIPPVDFSKYPEANAQCQALRASVLGQKRAATDGPLHIHQLKKEDPSHYTEFMCYALFCMGHRVPRSAQGFVEQALSIAEESGASRSRECCEALFIRAHLIKLCAGVAADLDGATLCFRQIHALQAQREPNDLRYDAEAFSVSCHRHYFDVLPKKPIEVDRAELFRTFQRGMALLTRLPEPGLVEQRDYSSEYVRQQLLGNLVQLAFLCKFGHHLTNDSFDVFLLLEPDPSLQDIEREMPCLIAALVEVCLFLDGDTGSLPLPRASSLTLSLAALGAAVWPVEGKVPEWPDQSMHHGPVIDRQRMRYLEGVRRRQARGGR